LTRPPGELVPVDGGRRLHLVRRGDGTPTVIFESGAGVIASSWRHVQDGVATFTGTCAWDRPGYGWSDPPGAPLSLASVQTDLLELLQAAGVAPPYVIVAHSLGAHYARHLAGECPDLVAGMVLVDPTHEHQLDGLGRPARAALQVVSRLQSHAPALLARLARGRTRQSVSTAFPELDHLEVEAMLDVQLQPRALRLQFAEVARVSGEARGLSLRPGALGDIPFAVVAADKVPGGERFAWHRQEVQLPELVALSRRGRLRIADGSGHGIPWERPEAVIDVVREVVTEVRGRLGDPDPASPFRPTTAAGSGTTAQRRGGD
jgi:pimeloyl-ACP methyl ester carboxylesterase